jgi:hypothetical protein
MRIYKHKEVYIQMKKHKIFIEELDVRKSVDLSILTILTKLYFKKYSKNVRKCSLLNYFSDMMI